MNAIEKDVLNEMDIIHLVEKSDDVLYRDLAVRKNMTAKKIADKFERFVEWIVEAPLIVRTDHNTWEVYKTQEAYEWGDDYEEMTFGSIYQYWIDNIDGK